MKKLFPALALALGGALLAIPALFAVLALQRRAVRNRMPRLPAAAGPTSGRIEAAGATIKLLALGESTVAGVGAPDQAQALAGQIAAALAKRTGRAVEWQARGQIGATAAIARRVLAPAVAAEQFDLIVLGLGVNDVLQMHSPSRWASDLEGLLADLRQRVGLTPVLIAPVPPIGRFPALPQPLRAALGLHAALLDRAARRLAPRLDRVVYSAARLDQAAGFFCADRFHPSVAGYRAWGQRLAPELAALLAAE